MEKRKIFLYLGGKNMIFEKKGGGDINIFDNIHPWTNTNGIQTATNINLGLYQILSLPDIRLIILPVIG